jgi:hypothetical protein
VRGADRIVVLEHGRIAEMRSHEKLASRGGYYVRLEETRVAASWARIQDRRSGRHELSLVNRPQEQGADGAITLPRKS